MTNSKINLTEKEIQVLRAIPVAGDFGPEGQGNYTSDIARHLGRNGKSVGGSVASLVKKGFITQQETDYGPQNRNDSWLMFTERGQEWLDKAIQYEKREAQAEREGKIRDQRNKVISKRFEEVAKNLVPDKIFFSPEETNGVAFGEPRISSLFGISFSVEVALLDEEGQQHRFATIHVDRRSYSPTFSGEINWSAWGNTHHSAALLFAEGMKAISNIAADLEAAANEITSAALEDFPLSERERRVYGAD